MENFSVYVNYFIIIGRLCVYVSSTTP